MQAAQTETMGSPASAYWTICRRVYLVWAIILLVGFVATHFFQRPSINGLWLVLSLVGLGYMVRQTSLPSFRRSGQAHLYYVGYVWVLVIGLGLLVSIATFMGRTPLNPLAQYLGVFWLIQMGIGHWLNGMVDPPRRPYWLTGGIQVAAGILCLLGGLEMQFLVAGIVGAGAMALLIPLHPGQGQEVNQH